MHQHGHGTMDAPMVRRHYLMLALNLFVSAIIMYFVMFSMIWTIQDFFNNLNMFYMVLLMVAPMGMLMLAMMRMMYPDRRLNLVLYAAFALLFILGLIGMRDQSLVGDRQFVRSMIPHHSGAILMCREAKLSDRELRELCGSIVRSQQAEIAQMKTILKRL
jgi:hypothetical protein